jgi:hypothetical protein
MRPRGHLPKPAVFSRRLLSLAVRSVAIASMSFAAAFGFLSGATSPGAHYDPHTFAIGVSALLGAACGGIGILISRIRQMKIELRDMETRLDEAADRNWEISEAQERTKSFFETQGDVIVRRGSAGAITYATMPSVRLPAARAKTFWRPRLRFRSRNREKPRRSPTARASTTRRSPRPQARAGSPGARSRCGPAPPARRKASAAT